MEKNFKKLIRFLHVNNAYASFYFYVRHSKESQRKYSSDRTWFESFLSLYEKDYHMYEFINSSFPWEETKEGRDYWEELSDIAERDRWNITYTS